MSCEDYKLIFYVFRMSGENWLVIMNVVVHTNDYGIPNRDGNDDKLEIMIYARDRYDLPFYGTVELEHKYSMALFDILKSVHDTNLAKSEASFDDLCAMFAWTDMDNSQCVYERGEREYDLCFTFDQSNEYYDELLEKNVLSVITKRII